MASPDLAIPFPDLRIIDIDRLHPHEEHDPQRSEPLIERLRHADVFTNPPIVAPMDAGETQFVVLDGANRYHCFAALGYRHLLVQVAPYDGGAVELSVWRHIISDWHEDALIAHLERIPDIHLESGWDSAHSAAQILLQSGSTINIHAEIGELVQRNASLCEVVRVYRQHATLYRTALSDPVEIWGLYPDAVALVLFPYYSSDDIIASARAGALLPPGLSRHVIHGRALGLGYPMSRLYDPDMSTAAKNDALRTWVQEKLARRGVRYYAESTYQFNE